MSKPYFPDILLQAFDSLIKTFVKTGVSYALMGGVALQFWGRVRQTKDIDVVVSISSKEITWLLEELLKNGFRIKGPAKRYVGEFKFVRLDYCQKDGLIEIEIDLFTSETPFQATALQRAIEIELGNRTLRVVVPEDLIIYKALSDRIIDRVDIENIVEEQKGKLDKRYISLWAKRFKIYNALKKRHPKLII